MGLASIVHGAKIQNATIINVHVQNTSANVSRFATHLRFNIFKPKDLVFSKYLASSSRSLFSFNKVSSTMKNLPGLFPPTMFQSIHALVGKFYKS